MKLKELLSNIKTVKIEGGLDIDITGIAYDSRKVTQGDVFVAVAGMEKDGARFIPQAIELGAVAVITEKDADLQGRATKITVDNARSALADISSAFYGFPSSKIKVIGVTGTNGKTTTTYFIESILKAAGNKTAVVGTVGSRIGGKEIPTALTTPESRDLQKLFSQMLEDKVTHAVMEVSSHSIAMKRIRGIDFDCAVYTNLSHDHLDFHRTMEEYLNAKLNLFRTLGMGKKKDVSAVINIDDNYSEAFIDESNGTIITYSLKQKASVQGRILSSLVTGMTLEISLNGSKIEINTPLFGKFNAYNILAATACAKCLGIELSKIKEGIESLKSVPGRVERIVEGQDFEVIVDFAHSPDSLEKVIRESSHEKKGKSILVFGCTGDRDKLKRPVMGEIAGKMADIVVLTSDDPHGEDPGRIIKDVEKGLSRTGKIIGKDLIIISDREKAIKKSIEIAKSGDIVIIAGRGHEKFQEIKGVNLELDDRAVARAAIRKGL